MKCQVFENYNASQVLLPCNSKVFIEPQEVCQSLQVMKDETVKFENVYFTLGTLEALLNKRLLCTVYDGEGNKMSAQTTSTSYTVYCQK